MCLGKALNFYFRTKVQDEGDRFAATLVYFGDLRAYKVGNHKLSEILTYIWQEMIMGEGGYRYVSVGFCPGILEFRSGGFRGRGKFLKMELCQVDLRLRVHRSYGGAVTHRCPWYKER